MKKLITLTIAMMLLLTACGSGASTQQTDTGSTDSTVSKLFTSDSIEGEWSDGWGTLITIEGDTALIEHMGDYLGSVDTDAKTITIKDGAHNNDYETTGDATFSYQLINDKLVLDQIDGDDYNILGLDKTYSYTRYEPEAQKEGGEESE